MTGPDRLEMIEIDDLLLATAVEAASRAGEVLVRKWGERRQVTVKGYRDLVTDADTAAEDVVISTIRARFPDHAILSEEAGEQGADTPCVWVVDPLDGTMNYSRAHPVFSVSVAAVVEGEAVVGVVHDPMRDHTFTAQRGGGAALNGRPIHPSQTDQLHSALVALDWTHADADRADVLARLTALAPRCRAIRSLGSAALALAYVGAGWLDLYFARGLYPWDAAAGGLIIAEAGGQVCGLGGESWEVGQPTLLATNGRLEAQVLDVWKEGGGS